MYKYPILLIKGFIIGIAKIIPGVSGSMIAIYLGLYEKAIDSISNFFKDLKRNIIFLGTIGAGVLFAILIFSKIIHYLLLNYYYITMLFFIGLLFGSLKSFSKLINIKTKTESFIFLVSFLIGIISFKQKSDSYIYSDDLFNNLYVILIGFIDAITMIIPGLSGTAIFMLLGCYSFFLSIFTNISVYNIKIIFLFIIGLVSGVVIVSRIMNYLLKKKSRIVYPIIFGLSLSSILILLLNVIKIDGNILNGLLFFIVGFIIAKKLS